MVRDPLLHNPEVINAAGKARVDLFDTRSMSHGYTRRQLHQVNAPGGVGGTSPTRINPREEIAGNYLDADFMSHVFLRKYRQVSDKPGASDLQS